MSDEWLDEGDDESVRGESIGSSGLSLPFALVVEEGAAGSAADCADDGESPRVRKG